MKKFSRREQLDRLSTICLANVQSIREALKFLDDNSIGAFRILTPLFPRYTHPEIGYEVKDLPDEEKIKTEMSLIQDFSKNKDIRLSFHPDQFNVLSSPQRQVINHTLNELEYQGKLAENLGAGVINIHAGGSYGNKNDALSRFKENFQRLSETVRSRLTLENDDTVFTPSDLLPVCRELGIPFVYDVHHHRCLRDNMSEEEATDQCIALWQALDREPYFHISSPRNGWREGSPKPHADFIDPADFPAFWLELDATIDVEAKAKELAVIQLKKDLGL